MSAPKLVDAPQPDEAADPSPSTDDGWALLEGLRRRIDDQTALGRKTTAQVSQLAESIAALVAQQRRRSLWLNVNSFVAYLMFTILCAAGCYLLYQSRARELAAARDQAVGERDAAVRRADETAAKLASRDAADARAWEIYQLLEAGRRGDAVAKLDALRDQPLSKTERAVLSARVHDTQVVEVDAALKSAIAAVKAGRPGDVVKPLEAALALEPAGTRAATLHYYLGLGYAKTDLASSATHLQAAVAADVDQEDARFQLASVLDRSGAYAAARAEYDRFATAHPQSPLAVFAMRRSATLVRIPPSGQGAAMSPAPGAAAGVGGPGGAVGATPGARAGVVGGPAGAGGVAGPGGAVGATPGARAGVVGGPAGAGGVAGPGGAVGATPGARAGVVGAGGVGAPAARPGAVGAGATAGAGGALAPAPVAPRPGAVAPPPAKASPATSAAKPANDDASQPLEPTPEAPGQ